jgi:Ca2+-binding RTX toxin-like protein
LTTIRVDVGPGNDRIAYRVTYRSQLVGREGNDVIEGGEGEDTAEGGDGADRVSGDDGADAVSGGEGNDQVAGQAGDDAVDGGAGDDSLEFGGAAMVAGAGLGADDLRGGAGIDRLSYNDHPAAIRLTLDEQPGDGSAGEGDNVHADVETVIGTTGDDVLIGDAAAQDLYGHGGRDQIEGQGGDDLLNGGTSEDTLSGGEGSDALEGSAGGDLLDGGPGYDFFEGDNPCIAQPCTGGPDDIRARDGGEDSIDCGVGADRATIDWVDVSALEAPSACESVDRAAPPVAAQAPLSGPAGPSDAAPAGTTLGAADAAGAAMRVLRLPKLRALVRRGLAVRVTCPGPCRIRARLTLGRKVVASARRSRKSAGTSTVTLKATRAGKRRLRGLRRARVTLRVDVTDGAGEKTPLKQGLTLRR